MNEEKNFQLSPSEKFFLYTVPIIAHICSMNVIVSIIFFLLCVIFYVGFRSASEIQTIPELKAQKDCFLIWSAGGSLLLFAAQAKALPLLNEHIGIPYFTVIALYVVLMAGIYYKHLCRAIYENEGRMFECTVNEKIYIVKVTEISK